MAGNKLSTHEDSDPRDRGALGSLAVKHTRSVARDLAAVVLERSKFERRAHHHDFELPLVNRLFTRTRLITKGLEVTLYGRCKEGSV